MNVFHVISPHTEQSIAEVAASGPADVESAVIAARTAFDSGPWGRSQPSERIAAIRRLAEVYDQRRAEMAETKVMDPDRSRWASDSCASEKCTQNFASNPERKSAGVTCANGPAPFPPLRATTR